MSELVYGVKNKRQKATVKIIGVGRGNSCRMAWEVT